jgi:hypothetical protein
MKRIITVSVLAVALLLTGCSDSPETVAEDYIDIAISGNLDEVKTVASDKFYYRLRSNAEDCLTKGLKSRDKKNEDYVEDTTKAIKEAIKGISFSEKYMALGKATRTEIRKVLKENEYPIVEECKADTLWKYSEIIDYDILKVDVSEDEKRAEITFKVLFEDDDGRVAVKMKNDVEFGWQVVRAPH